MKKDWKRIEEGYGDTREKLCVKSYDHIESILKEYDESLADLFSKVTRHISEYNCFEGEIDIGNLLQEHGTFDNIRINGEEINLIPSETKGDCHKNCVLVSDCQWSGRGQSFQKHAKEIVKCWLKCIQVNQRTLILTTAWDEKSFKKTYKEEFDIYSKKHRLAVVLITGTGASLVYLGQ